MDKKPNLLGVFAVVCASLLLIWGAQLHAAPPAPLPATAPPAVFSSGRAMSWLRRIGQQAHPIGTSENEKVRDYLAAELAALGLSPQVQTGVGTYQSSRGGEIGLVHNLLVRIPGSAAGKALLLTAHYDSVPTGPGAADDGASVAAILESLRALKAGAPLRNDLICLFSDGEEAGLLGAAAFVSEHPWAKEVGLVLNFEYRGNRGPFILFETSSGNGKLIAAVSAAVKQPLGNSLLYEIYKIMPNDTDLSVYKRAAIPGLNFAAAEGFTSYHTQLDRPELLDEASLQHEGEIMLALVHHFGNVSLEALQAPDRVYFDAPGLGLVSYSVRWVLPLAGLLMVLFAAVWVRGAKLGKLRVLQTVLGSLAFLSISALLATGAQGLWAAVVWLRPAYRLMLHGDTYNSHWYLLAFVMLTVGLFALLQGVLRRWLLPMELAMGAMLCWVLMLAASSVWMPGISYPFFWTLLPALVSVAVLFSARLQGTTSATRMWILFAGVSPGLLLFAPLVRFLCIALTPAMIFATVALLVLFLGVTIPLLSALERTALLSAPALGVGVALICGGLFTSGFDAGHPRPDNLFYALEGTSGRALWLSSDSELDPWTEHFFQAGQPRRKVPELFGAESPLYWTSPAPALVQSPDVQVVADGQNADVRSVELRITSRRQAPKLTVSVEAAEVLRASVQERPISTCSTRPQKRWRLNAYGFGHGDLRVALQLPAGKPFRVTVIDTSYGLPEAGIQARPAGLMTQPFLSSDTTNAFQFVEFK